MVPARPEHLATPAGRRFPPVLLPHMAEREPEWAAQVERTLQHCRAQGIPAAELRIRPQPVTPQLLRRSAGSGCWTR